MLSGGRTGITGAAAAVGVEAVVSLEKMNRLLDFSHRNGRYYLRCQPGISLQELGAMLNNRTLPQINALTEDYNNAKIPKLWFPVNPTETNAHLGGVVSNNASGARTYGYGSTREWVQGLSVVLSDGSLLELRRGEAFADNTKFHLQRTGGGKVRIDIPEFSYPLTKCTCGYYLHPDMDLVDLFIGSEGTLGAICEIELRLMPKPEKSCSVMLFSESEEQALDLVYELDGHGQCVAIEYFDHSVLQLIKSQHSAKYNLKNWDCCAVYCEFVGSNAEIEKYLRTLAGIAKEHGVRQTWASANARELRMQKDFRHLAPEEVNSIIARRKADNPKLHKIGTDMAVPLSQLRGTVVNYRQALSASGLESVIFGHIGDGHLHVNILPKNYDELVAAKDLYARWAVDIAKIGGAVAAEHGIGRIKKEMLKIQYPPKVVDAMRKIRTAFDSSGVLGPGVLFDIDG